MLAALRRSRERLAGGAGGDRGAATRSSTWCVAGERFDVVFLDPPFRQNALPALLAKLPPRLRPGARVYLEAAERGGTLRRPGAS